jgi:uncharacterized caspase-like protein
MEKVPPELYLKLAYHTPRGQRMWVLAQHMARVYGDMGMTEVEIEEALEREGESFVKRLQARARGVAR